MYPSFSLKHLSRAVSLFAALKKDLEGQINLRLSGVHSHPTSAP